MNDCGVSRGGSGSGKTLFDDGCLARFFSQVICISTVCANSIVEPGRSRNRTFAPVTRFPVICLAVLMLIAFDSAAFIGSTTTSPSAIAGVAPSAITAAAPDVDTPAPNAPKSNESKPDAPKSNEPQPGEPSGGKAGDKPAEKPADKPGEKTPEKVADGKPRKPEILIKRKDFKREGDNAALRVSFDDIDLLKVLNMELVSADCIELMPEWLSKLDGKRIRIRGYMHPFAAISDKIVEFPLARDTEICCFGRNPKMYDIIQVKMKTGVSTPFIDLKPFDVEGVLRIKLDDGFTGEVPPSEDEYPQFGGLYYLDDAVIVKRQ